MKILHLIAQYPDRTGSGIYCRNLIKNFNKTGASNGLVYGRNSSQERKNLTPHDYEVVFDSVNLPFYIPGMSDVMPYESSIYSKMDEKSLNMWKDAFREKLKGALSTFKPDVIISHHLFLLTAIASSEFDGDIIGICHGTDIRQFRANPDFCKRENIDLRNLKHVIALSHEQKKEIIEIYGIDENKITVLGGAYDDSIFYPDYSVNKSITKFIYAGRISDAKGVYELIEAFKSIDDTSISLKLLAPITHEEEDRLLNAISKDKRIKLYDCKDQIELASEIRKGDIFVMPSLYEGLGLLALEGLASGLRLVVTDLTPLREFLGENIWNDKRISVIKMPRLIDVDKIDERDKESHIRNLREKLIEQRDRHLKNNRQKKEVLPSIKALSWEGLSKKMLNLIID